MKKLLIFAPILMMVCVSVLFSQAPTSNPHGDLKWDCQDCHTAESWKAMRADMTFDHDQTGFHLVGTHANADCASCHKDLTFSHVGVSCIDCHTDQHNGKLGLNCENCHTPLNWSNQKDVLELHAQRGFALTGVHAIADCESCHRGASNQEFAGAPTNCIECHSLEFTSTTNPSHTLAGFTSDCQQCHHTASGSWHNVVYAHTNAFPLTGAHKRTDCQECHSVGYAGTSTECYACHSASFATAVDPNHVQGGFDHDCSLCHSTISWIPAQFDHAASGFPLTGKHITTACTSCHTTSYSGTPTDCYSCHSSDYTGTSDPNHIAANFPTDCLSCHTTNGWSPSTWNHDAQYFPIYSGAHNNQWSDCSTCHVQPQNYTVFECINCHDHSQSSMDSHHSGVNNYQYLSSACYTCHPRGRH